MQEPFATFQAQFESFLDRHLGSKNRLNEAIIYACQSPGKRLRPRFVFESANLSGLAIPAAESLAFGIELVHLFSLVHDDLPCLDNDDFRRGLPTVHKKFDEATALLAGDALLNLAFQAVLECAPFLEKNAFLAGLKFFADSVGTLGMIGGQSIELETTLNHPKDSKKELQLETLLHIQDLKTGALFRAALVTPFLFSGNLKADANVAEVLQYASDFGFAFQIADDLEDETQDQLNQRKNILALLGKTQAIELAKKRLLQTQVSAKFAATAWLAEKLN